MTCHKKCYPRANKECLKDVSSSSNIQPKGGSVAKGKVFGRPLGQLDLSMGKVPAVVECLITIIEMYGMYTEGIYRKPGVSKPNLHCYFFVITKCNKYYSIFLAYHPSK